MATADGSEASHERGKLRCGEFGVHGAMPNVSHNTRSKKLVRAAKCESTS